jgi:hypothetical protein
MRRRHVVRHERGDGIAGWKRIRERVIQELLEMRERSLRGRSRGTLSVHEM